MKCINELRGRTAFDETKPSETNPHVKIFGVQHSAAGARLARGRRSEPALPTALRRCASRHAPWLQRPDGRSRSPGLAGQLRNYLRNRKSDFFFRSAAKRGAFAGGGMLPLPTGAFAGGLVASAACFCSHRNLVSTFFRISRLRALLSRFCVSVASVIMN